MVLFITLPIITLKSECVLQLVGIFKAPPQLIVSGRRAPGESVKEEELRHEGVWDQGARYP